MVLWNTENMFVTVRCSLLWHLMNCET